MLIPPEVDGIAALVPTPADVAIVVAFAVYEAVTAGEVVTSGIGMCVGRPDGVEDMAELALIEDASDESRLERPETPVAEY